MLRFAPIAAMMLIATPALAQTAPEGKTVEVNGMDLYYEVSGSGDPIVVLHGAYMNIPTMGGIIPALAENHTVYAIEFQGHGRTEDIDRPITYPNLASDVAAFMDAVGLEKADIFGYSMGAAAGLRLAIDHPEKVDQLVAASVSYDMEGAQPAFLAMIPTMVPEMFIGSPMEDAWKQYAPNPEGFRPFVERMIALEHEPLAWGDEVKELKSPVLIIAGDADMMTLEHLVSMFRLLGGGEPGDMGQPLGASRLAILPATSHTAVIDQVDLLMGFTEPFLEGETPKGMFDQ
ncbi:oxidoreductase [Devosia riboflavina]|uniref:Oxidoreductase n=1 Tax=Devosia riboflavina TaxID=46914 RepID=A0A087LYZ0_9HYPH|nr:alpha/beta hydrolase [Devosia riboflavina]KFL29843.1 oxidoreductase [Devosia riboflavina]